MISATDIHPIMGNHEYALIQVLNFVAQEITDEDFIQTGHTP